MLTRPMLFFNTVRYLKFRQIINRVKRNFLKPRVLPTGPPDIALLQERLEPVIKCQQKISHNGALKFLNKEHGEFKSIRVSDRFRSEGNGSKIINHLINEAKKLKIKRLSLETGAGDFFSNARKLFNECGFETCEPFSHYKNDFNSVYMTMLISNK